MRKYTLIDLLHEGNAETTEDLLKVILPKLGKAHLTDLLKVSHPKMDEKEREKIINKMRVYKSRIEKGERNKKVLSEVFRLFGYEICEMAWKKVKNGQQMDKI